MHLGFDQRITDDVGGLDNIGRDVEQSAGSWLWGLNGVS